MSKALLIIDVQNDYFESGKSALHNSLAALDNIERVLVRFRGKKLPVIHVQHINTRPGATFFLPDTEGVLIHKRLTPREEEYVVVKHAPNSFFETELDDILIEEGVTELIVCGMMSHMCVDTTVRACKDRGIKVTLLHDACATKDLVFNEKTIPAETVHATFMASLQGMFANVIWTEELIL
jgi:nicotinamidase-related amidase